MFVELYCSVRIEVFALAYLFSGDCLVVMRVVVLESVFLLMVSYVYWVFFVCSMFGDSFLSIF